jgi:hypothetical protein
MNSMFVSAAATAAAPLAKPAVSQPDAGVALVAAAGLLLADLERGRTINAQALRAAMIASFDGSDAEGAWDWKTAYDACPGSTASSDCRNAGVWSFRRLSIVESMPATARALRRA